MPEVKQLWNLGTEKKKKAIVCLHVVRVKELNRFAFHVNLPSAEMSASWESFSFKATKIKGLNRNLSLQIYYILWAERGVSLERLSTYIPKLDKIH